jgi:hypothetical protein
MKAEVVGALQGLSSSEADMRSCLAEELCDRLGYGSCQADYDVWSRPAQRPDDGKYYKYVLAHTDDILCLSRIPTAICSHLDQQLFTHASFNGPSKDVSGGSHRLVQVW